MRLAKEPSFRTDLLAEATKIANEFSYQPEVNPAGFSLQAGGMLHPMSPFRCNSSVCRRRNVRAFAQVASLYSDTTILTDLFSFGLLNKAESNSPWQDQEVADLAADIHTILELEPLIRSGALQFSSPIHRLCEVHDKPTRELASRVGERGFELLLRDMNVNFEQDWLTVSGAAVLGNTSVGLRLPRHQIGAIKGLKSKAEIHRSVARKFKKELVEELVCRAQYAMVDCICAAEAGATIAATSPIDILASRAVFEPVPEPAIEMDVSLAGRLNLPWIPQLTPSELVDLRERALHALPNFRLEIARSIQSSTSADLKAIAKSLQNEVVGLDVELRAALAKRTGGGPAAILLGLGMILCGIATANPLVSAAGAPLVAGGCSLWSTDKSAVSAVESARSKPAYVLLSARELLEERH